MWNLGPVWLRRATADLMFFNNPISGTSYISAPQFTNQNFCPHKNTELAFKNGIKRRSPKKVSPQFFRILESSAPKFFSLFTIYHGLLKRSPDTVYRTNPYSNVPLFNLGIRSRDFVQDFISYYSEWFHKHISGDYTTKSSYLISQ